MVLTVDRCSERCDRDRVVLINKLGDRVVPVTKLCIGSFVVIFVMLLIIVISWYAGYSFEVYSEHLEDPLV